MMSNKDYIKKLLVVELFCSVLGVTNNFEIISKYSKYIVFPHFHFQATHTRIRSRCAAHPVHSKTHFDRDPVNENQVAS